ncbi:MAG TPA: homoserine dehydrogenase [Candidatus Omnitrophota bacterium]|nr:homoserine dehydrogenase [Candidatus Omnitrophota bacterium]HPS20145.1 homoserine dehydrogenase [Candidatus Omnitrophota bacterium]
MKELKPVKVGLIGAGTIGKGVVDLLLHNGKLITARTGVSISLEKVCDRDKNALDAVAASGVAVTSNADDILNSKDIDIVVELIGGINPAKDFILRAINNRKNVVTANKAVLSTFGKEVFLAAVTNNVSIGFEASVGGAIPIIRALKESFISNNFEVIYGILNGTTNFILSMMEEDHSFEKALQIAQKKGIAESNPELDLSGKDSAHKLSILALLGFGINISPEKIYTEGIQDIMPQDITYAKRWGYNIKLLAIAKNDDSGLELRVSPALMPAKHLLANVKGENNAIFVKGDFLEESLLYGKGAGQRPTATSVVGDIIDIAKRVAYIGRENIIPFDPIGNGGDKKLVNIDELMLPYYLRFSVIDKPGVLASVSAILAENDISIASMSQEERKRGQSVTVIMITHKAREGSLQKAIQNINSMDYVTSKTVVIRIED